MEGACVQAVAVAVALTWPVDEFVDDAVFVEAYVEAVAAALAAAVEPNTSDGGWRARLRLAADLAERGAPDEIAAMAGAMAGAIAGALLGDEAIPARWIDRTGSGPMVRDLADRLRAGRL